MLASVCLVVLASALARAQKSATSGTAKTPASNNAAKSSESQSPAKSADPQQSATSNSAATSAPTGFAALDAIVKNAMTNGSIPGAVLLVGHNGTIAYRKAYGNRTVGPNPEPMTVDTIFDLASLTKVIATTTCVMRLEQLGQIKLNDPVVKYIPDFAQNGKEDVTIRMLLTHYSGLPADLDLKQPWNGLEEGYARANATSWSILRARRSSTAMSASSCWASWCRRSAACRSTSTRRQHVFGPLGMTSTRFNPPPTWAPRIAPTQRDEHTGQMLRGTVHDPTARQMGGVAGDAGLFSTADDVAKFAQAMLNGGAPILSPLIVEKMTTPQQPPNCPTCAAWVGTSIRPSPPIAANCCPSARSATPDSPAHRCGSIRRPTPTSSC